MVYVRDVYDSMQQKSVDIGQKTCVCVRTSSGRSGMDWIQHFYRIAFYAAIQMRSVKWSNVLRLDGECVLMFACVRFTIS